MSISIGAANTSAKSTNTSSVTTSAMDTTGMQFFIVTVHDYSATRGTVSDSKSNTWTPLTSHQNGTTARCTIWYCIPTSVGTLHTFTVSGIASSFPAIWVTSWIGFLGTPTFDLENGANVAGSTTLASGSVTPSFANSLVITGMTANTDGGFNASIDSGFTSVGTVLGSANSESGSIAYIVETAITAQNPTWTNGINNTLAASIAVFRDPLAGVLGNMLLMF